MALRTSRVLGAMPRDGLVGIHGQCLITQRRKWGDEGRDWSGYMAGQSWEATRVLASRSPYLGTSVPPPAAKEGQGLSLGHLLTIRSSVLGL